MPPDLLDRLVIEVPGIAQEVLADLVRVLEAVEDIVKHAALTEVHPIRLAFAMDLLQPDLVVRCGVGRHMLLELHNIRVRNDLGIVRLVERRGITMDGLVAEGPSGHRRDKRQGNEAAHDE